MDRDFSGGSKSVSLDSSASVMCVDVEIIDDVVHENTQHFDVVFDFLLEHPNLKFGSIRHVDVTILDDDGMSTTYTELARLQMNRHIYEYCSMRMINAMYSVAHLLY